MTESGGEGFLPAVASEDGARFARELANAAGGDASAAAHRRLERPSPARRDREEQLVVFAAREREHDWLGARPGRPRHGALVNGHGGGIDADAGAACLSQGAGGGGEAIRQVDAGVRRAAAGDDSSAPRPRLGPFEPVDALTRRVVRAPRARRPRAARRARRRRRRSFPSRRANLPARPPRRVEDAPSRAARRSP